MELGEDLAGIEQAARIEGAFQALLLIEVDLVEHGRHEVALFDANAVLARQHAADLDAKTQDVRAEFLSALELARLVRIVKDERVEVAVAGVKDVGAAQPVLLRELAHMRQHVRQALPRNGAVDAVVIGRNAANRGKSRLASGPEGEA